MTDERKDPGAELNFDEAVPAAAAGRATGAVQCASCQRQITTEYFTANGAPLCATCRELFAQHAMPLRDPALLVRAALFGALATLAGAAVYYAVMRLFNLEIGLVAILSGWMIGKAARTGAAGRGGRRLQVGAAFLTYLSVALAYVPYALQATEPGSLSLLGVGVLALTLPVIVILGSLPGGLLSAGIIGFGMMQAWQLTATARFEFEGPFRVAGGATP
jgi:hypothetical protein